MQPPPLTASLCPFLALSGLKGSRSKSRRVQTMQDVAWVLRVYFVSVLRGESHPRRRLSLCRSSSASAPLPPSSCFTHAFGGVVCITQQQRERPRLATAAEKQRRQQVQRQRKCVQMWGDTASIDVSRLEGDQPQQIKDPHWRGPADRTNISCKCDAYVLPKDCAEL